MPTLYHNSTEQSNADDPAIALAQRRAAAELRLLESVYADPTRAVPAAQNVGVSDHAFDADDLLLLWRCATLAGHRGQAVLMHLAARALREFRFWDETQIPGNYGVGCWWNDRLLAVLAGAMFPCTPIATDRARKLLAIVARWDQAMAAAQRCEDLLAGRIDPEPLRMGMERAA